MPLTGYVVEVITHYAGSLLSDDVSAGASEIAVDTTADFPPTGSLRLSFLDPSTGDETTEDIDYTAVDDDLLTITLDGTLAESYPVETTVSFLPLAPVSRAYVQYDPNYESVGAFLPEHFKTTYKTGLADGEYEEGEGAEVIVDEVAGQQTVVKVIRVPSELDTVALEGEIDATQNPIVVTTDDGEAARLDGDGLETFTDDPVQVGTIVGTFGGVAIGGGYIVAIDLLTSDIRKFDATTGAEILSGFPIAGTFTRLTTDGTHIYAVDVNNDIAKYLLSTGASVGGGFPIAGTFKQLTTDSTYIYAIDVNNDIAKYAKSNGAAAGGGFPIAGTFTYLTTDGTSIWATDVNDYIAKYNASTGAAITSGFPITGWFAGVAHADGFIYALDGDTPSLQKYDGATGLPADDSNYPALVGALLGRIVTDGTYLVATDSNSDIVKFNIDTISTFRLTSADGGVRVGPQGTNLAVGRVAYVPTWTGNTTNPTASSHKVSAAYSREGQEIRCRIGITFGSANYGTGRYAITLPFVPVRGFAAIGYFYDDSVGGAPYPLMLVADAGTATAQLWRLPTTAGGILLGFTSAAPVTIALNDRVEFEFGYEAASA